MRLELRPAMLCWGLKGQWGWKRPLCPTREMGRTVLADPCSLCILSSSRSHGLSLSQSHSEMVTCLPAAELPVRTGQSSFMLWKGCATPRRKEASNPAGALSWNPKSRNVDCETRRYVLLTGNLNEENLTSSLTLHYMASSPLETTKYTQAFWVEPRASDTLGKSSTTELHPSPAHLTFKETVI